MNINTKKALGQFPTPLPLARSLVRWGTAGGVNPCVLDPSFGGCVFLEALYDSLDDAGSPEPERRIFGIDIDPAARVHLRPLLEKGALDTQFITGDFLSTMPQAFGLDAFTAIVGNPPYVRHHQLDRDLYGRARATIEAEGFALSGRASYWAYFVLHSLKLLAHGGRMAMVLPGALVHSDYGEYVRRQVVARFEGVRVVLVQDHMFSDADEETVLLLAWGFGAPHSTYEVVDASGADASELDLGSLTPALAVTQHDPAREEPAILQCLLRPEALDVLLRLQLRQDVIRLGDWTRVSIGVVTGANAVFVVNDRVARATEVPSCRLGRTIQHASHLRGLVLTDEDVQSLSQSGKATKLLLLSPDGDELPPKLKEYLERAESRGVHLRSHCRSRNPWYCLEDATVPPAFLTYMAGTSPRMVINRAGSTCTNAIHRLSWLGDRDERDWERVTLGSLTSLFRLSCELEGRSYGGGVLKVEPKEARVLSVPVPCLESGRVSTLFKQADALLRTEGLAEATSLVDRELLVGAMDLSPQQCRALSEALAVLSDRRKHRAEGTQVELWEASRASPARS